MDTANGTFDGNGGQLLRKLAFQGFLLMSVALACLYFPPQEGLSVRESFPVPFYLALWFLFLSGLGYMLLSVWASDNPTSRSDLAKQFLK